MADVLWLCKAPSIRLEFWMVAVVPQGGAGRKGQVEETKAGNFTEAQEDISRFTYVAVIVLQQHHRLHHVPEHHHGHAEYG